MAFEFCCPNAPVDTPGLLPDTNGATCGVCRLMPGFPGFSGSPTAAELSGEHSLAGTLGSLIAYAGAATATNDTLPANALERGAGRPISSAEACTTECASGTGASQGRREVATCQALMGDTG
jgi:hypothetical protein